MNYRIEKMNLDGTRERNVRVYYVTPYEPEYWLAVTGIPCPITGCMGMIQWYEAGYVPGYRICDKCKRHFLAKGDAKQPTLVRVRQRRGL